MADEESPRITVTVKTPKEKHDVEINADAGVREFKEEVGKKFSAPIEQLCLIFAGKILKDGETLSQHGIKDGLTVHLVIKSSNRSQEQAAQRTTAPSSTSTPGTTTSGGETPNLSQTPFGLGGLGGLAGLGNLGMGSHNFMEMQQNMQREMMANPDLMRQMMENPFVQQLMSNPDVMRQMITSNPQMRDLMERNPEISHMLNNPELMRQTMELARNPAMLQELMRSQDRAMSNLESIPGGFNALQRMYRDVQEPMMDAAFGNQNPFASLVSQNSSDSSNTQQGTENTQPLPNPWAPASTQSSSSSTTSSSTAPTATVSTQDMLGSRGMQSLMQQMIQNPQLIENMMQAPYMQSMLQSMSANPEMANQIIGSNPMFASNPQLQQQVLQQLPTMLQQLQNPEMQALMTNPQALNAVMQIQQGMSTLQQTAPSLFPGLNPGSLALGGTSTTTATTTTTTSAITDTTSATTEATSSPTTTTTATVTTSSTGGTTTTPSTVGSTPQQNPEQLSNLMAHMMQLMAGGNQNQPPEQRYAAQLDQLATMGFVDREANIRALQATLGDVNAAIDRLLQQR
ncbi:ubiquilin-1-like [Saccostrea echinata]|uniref:ubiquilin-1-like n=1 Tax=Saccostrea echinata TaxID=191078 RepID=UPI002A826ADE|nr:ubiquilin-1-like [Saccostrea echinata]